MTKKEQIRQRLAELAANHGPLQTILATVESVDEDELTCVLQDDDITIADVRLRPVVNGKQSVTVIPKVDSWVLAARIEQDAEWAVIAFDEIDKYRVVIGDMLFEMKDAKFLVKSGDNSLKDVIRLIIEAIQATLVIQGNNPDFAKLTQALTKLNNLFD